MYYVHIVPIAYLLHMTDLTPIDILTNSVWWVKCTTFVLCTYQCKYPPTHPLPPLHLGYCGDLSLRGYKRLASQIFNKFPTNPLPHPIFDVLWPRKQNMQKPHPWDYNFAQIIVPWVGLLHVPFSCSKYMYYVHIIIFVHLYRTVLFVHVCLYCTFVLCTPTLFGFVDELSYCTYIMHTSNM